MESQILVSIIRLPILDNCFIGHPAFQPIHVLQKEIDATRAVRLAGRQERSKSKVERGPLLEGQSAIVFDFDGTLAPNLDLPEMRR